MKIISSQLHFASQNSAQNNQLRIGPAQAGLRSTPAASDGTIDRHTLDRRSLESHRQQQQQTISTLSTVNTQQEQHEHASQQQSDLRLFVERQTMATPYPTRTQATGMATAGYQLQDATESTGYQLAGKLALDDGRQLDFAVTGSMSRSLRIEAGSGIYASKLQRKDPLIVNFSASSAQLTEHCFAIDMDNDGSDENVSFATGGSGFLFLDRNQNGKLDGGRELFGANTGNGFAELAEFDDDNNGFIDSGDSIYRQLKVLSRSEDGNDSILTLEQHGMGALGVSAARTEFELTNDFQQSRGRLRATGVAIAEDGAVMTLQQVDLTNRSIKDETRFRQWFEDASQRETTSGNAGGDANAGIRAALKPNALDDMPDGPLRQALERLREMTLRMQQQREAAAEDDQNDAPKSLMEMLVDRFFPGKEDEKADKKTDRTPTPMTLETMSEQKTAEL